MRTREEAARFIEAQLSGSHECQREKDGCYHYGAQDLRELMDFIYQGSPQSEQEAITQEGAAKAMARIWSETTN